VPPGFRRWVTGKSQNRGAINEIQPIIATQNCWGGAAEGSKCFTCFVQTNPFQFLANKRKWSLRPSLAKLRHNLKISEHLETSTNTAREPAPLPPSAGGNSTSKRVVCSAHQLPSVTFGQHLQIVLQIDTNVYVKGGEPSPACIFKTARMRKYIAFVTTSRQNETP